MLFKSYNISALLINICFVVYVLSAYGFSGAKYLSSLAIVSNFLMFMFYLFYFKSIKFDKIHLYFIYYIVFFSAGALAADVIVLDKLGKFLVSSVSAFLIFIFLVNKIVDINTYVYTCFLASFINILVISTGFYPGPLAFDGRYSGFSGNPNTFMIATVLPCFFVFLYNNKFNLLAKLLSFILSVGVLYLSSSRKGVVLLLFLIIMILLNLNFYAAIILICSIAFFSVLVFINNDLLYDFLFLYKDDILIIKRLYRFLYGYDVSYEGRLDLFNSGIKLFWESPVFGHGIGQFEILSKYGVYAHNNMIEVAVSAGVLGVFLYYGFYLISWIKSFNNNISLFLKISMFLLALLVCDFATVSIYGKVEFLALILLLASIYVNDNSILVTNSVTAGLK